MKALAFLLLILPAAAFAQPPSWSTIQALPTGRAIHIQTRQAATNCAFTSATVDTLDCTESIDTGLFSANVFVPHHYLRADIVSIHKAPHKFRRTFTLIGATAGFVASLASGELILCVVAMPVLGALGLIIGNFAEIIDYGIPKTLLYARP